MTETTATGRKVTTSDRIKDLILADGLRPGDLLPTEGELCSRLGVSQVEREGSHPQAHDPRHRRRPSRSRHLRRPDVLDALVEALVFRGVLSPGDDLYALRDVVEVRKALDHGMSEQIVDALDRAPRTPNSRPWSTRWSPWPPTARPSRSRTAPSTPACSRQLGNSLVGQLVAAFWDVHTAVLPKLNVAVASDLEQTARAHGLMLEAAESGDAEAFRTAINAHYEPIMRALAEMIDCRLREDLASVRRPQYRT
jgi:hypothetical protein